MITDVKLIGRRLVKLKDIVESLTPLIKRFALNKSTRERHVIACRNLRGQSFKNKMPLEQKNEYTNTK